MKVFFAIQVFLIALTAPSTTMAAKELESVPPESVKITLDIANTPEKMAWGLMGVTSLAKDHGMLFDYDPPRLASIWMFNVHIDLSIAFIDAQNTIRELHHAKAFPAMLGPQHRIPNVYALSTLSLHDPIVRFFTERSIHSKDPVRYVLEMNKDWFTANKIEIGDVIDWKPGQKHAVIWRSSTLSNDHK